MDPRTIERAFLELYDENADALFRHCSFRVRDREQARDLTQEAFARLWEHLAEGNDVENWKAFLFRIANNLLIDHYRKKKESSLDALTEEGFEPVGEGAGAVIDVAAGREALRMVKRLPKGYREVILLRYVSDLSIGEIAKVTGESENAISGRIHRAISKLKQLLHYEKPD